MSIDPSDLRELAYDWARRDGPARGLDDAVGFIQKCAPENIPDVGSARKALDAWGVSYEEGGEPIAQLFSSTRTLKATLPAGWTVTRRGGGGHFELLDDRGAQRLRWHVHGWDPVSLSLGWRFYVRVQDVSATEDVAQVVDGTTVLHTVPVRYPHARVHRSYSDGSGGFTEPDSFTREQSTENYRAKDEAVRACDAWLDRNRPGHRDTLSSWSL